MGSKLINGEVIVPVKSDWNNEINMIGLCQWCYDKSCFFFAYLIIILYVKNTNKGKLHSTPAFPWDRFQNHPLAFKHDYILLDI